MEYKTVSKLMEEVKAELEEDKDRMIKELLRSVLLEAERKQGSANFADDRLTKYLGMSKNELTKEVNNLGMLPSTRSEVSRY